MGRDVGPSQSGSVAGPSRSAAGSGHGHVFAVAQQEAQDTPRVVTGTLTLFGLTVRVLLDSGLPIRLDFKLFSAYSYDFRKT